MSFTEKYQNFKEDANGWVNDNKRYIVIFILLFIISTFSFSLGYLVNREFKNKDSYTDKEMEKLRQIAARYAAVCGVR